jgi:hypothetical protein
MTRLGMGEKLLKAVSTAFRANDADQNARCPVVDGHIVVRPMPHSLGSAFLADLGRVARELDGGRFIGARLVGGRVCAVCGSDSPRRGGPQGGREHSGTN